MNVQRQQVDKLFYLLSLVMYIKARSFETEINAERSKRRNNIKSVSYYSISIISAVLAMKTKEIAFTLPVIISIYEFIFLAGKIKRRIFYLIPILLTMLIIPLSLIDFDKPIAEMTGDISDQTTVQKSISRSEYLFTQFRVIVTYIRLIVLPINQNLDYDYPVYHSFFNPEVCLSVLFLLSLLGSGIYALYRYRNTIPHTRLMAFGIFWFFVTLAVESSIVLQVIYEHRMYLPSVGIFILISLFTGIVMIRLERTQQMIIVSLFTIIIIFLSGATFLRNNIWQSKISLWEDTVKKSPSKFRPHYNLGVAYSEHGRTGDAIREYLTAIQIFPYHSKSHNNLGLDFVKMGRIGDAIKEYLTAIQIDPNYADAYYNLGIAFAAQGQINDAIKQYLSAIEIDPDYYKAHINLGVIYFKLGRTEDAIKEYLTAIQVAPGFAVVHYNLGTAYTAQGRTADAIKEYLTAIQIRPGFYEAHYNLGRAFMTQGQFDEAAREFKTVLNLNPNHAGARKNLDMIQRMIK